MNFESIYTKNIGNIGEAAAIAKFREFGIPVYLPYGDNEKVDMLAFFNNRFNKIQVKTCLNLKTDNCSYEVALASFHCNRNVSKVQFYSEDDVDYFVVYCVERGRCLLIPIQDVLGQRTITIRFDNFTRKSSIPEDKYDFAKVLGLKPLYQLAKETQDYQEKINYCVDCGAVVTTSSNRCISCSAKHRHQVNGSGAFQIEREELKNLIRTTSFVSIGKRFGVSDNSVRKWCKTHGLPTKASEIKEYSDEEWNNL